ncbi:Ig-like domain (group 3) [Anaeromicropila populeti]|uniref:Ig-like domain (Group 3) n=1 Tax=Anaeromicropila populeti TaxID=37658 RepID=A0A1I6KI21_9FIRM|nr:Ig-like domain (group 3) [Anaeromicropila populeti]
MSFEDELDDYHYVSGQTINITFVEPEKEIELTSSDSDLADINGVDGTEGSFNVTFGEVEGESEEVTLYAKYVGEDDSTKAEVTLMVVTNKIIVGMGDVSRTLGGSTKQAIVDYIEGRLENTEYSVEYDADNNIIVLKDKTGSIVFDTKIFPNIFYSDVVNEPCTVQKVKFRGMQGGLPQQTLSMELGVFNLQLGVVGSYLSVNTPEPCFTTNLDGSNVAENKLTITPVEGCKILSTSEMIEDIPIKDSANNTLVSNGKQIKATNDNGDSLTCATVLNGGYLYFEIQDIEITSLLIECAVENFSVENAQMIEVLYGETETCFEKDINGNNFYEYDDANEAEASNETRLVVKVKDKNAQFSTESVLNNNLRLSWENNNIDMKLDNLEWQVESVVSEKEIIVSTHIPDGYYKTISVRYYKNGYETEEYCESDTLKSNDSSTITTLKVDTEPPKITVEADRSDFSETDNRYLSADITVTVEDTTVSKAISEVFQYYNETVDDVILLNNVQRENISEKFENNKRFISFEVNYDDTAKDLQRFLVKVTEDTNKWGESRYCASKSCIINYVTIEPSIGISLNDSDIDEEELKDEIGRITIYTKSNSPKVKIKVTDDDLLKDSENSYVKIYKCTGSADNLPDTLDGLIYEQTLGFGEGVDLNSPYKMYSSDEVALDNNANYLISVSCDDEKNDFHTTKVYQIICDSSAPESVYVSYPFKTTYKELLNNIPINPIIEESVVNQMIVVAYDSQSGIADITASYNKVNGNGTFSEGITSSGVDANGMSYTTKAFTMTEYQTGTLTVTVTDKAGNKTSELVDNETIIDNTKPVVWVNNTALDEENVEKTKQHFIGDSSEIMIQVRDYCIKNIEDNPKVTLYKTGDGTPHVLEDLDWTSGTGGTYVQYLETTISGEELTELGDGEFELVIDASDEAGNVITDRNRWYYNIDQTAPVAVLEYESFQKTEGGSVIASEDVESGAFYHTCKFKVTVTEEHFSSDDFSSFEVYDSSNHKLTIPDDCWAIESKNGNEYVYILTLSDGMYEGVKVVCADQAGNKGESNLNSLIFGVDTVAPVIEEIQVSSAQGTTSGFYASAVTAKVTIVEANISEAKVTIKSKTGTAKEVVLGASSYEEKNSMDTTIFTVSPLEEDENDVNIKTCEIKLQMDGAYTITVFCADKREPDATVNRSKEISIDTGKPEVSAQFTSAETPVNDKYFKEVRIADITFKDVNLPEELTGENTWLDYVKQHVKNANGNPAIDFSGATCEKSISADTNQTTVTIHNVAFPGAVENETSGEYRLIVSCTDQATRPAINLEVTFIVDQIQPEVQNVDYLYADNGAVTETGTGDERKILLRKDAAVSFHAKDNMLLDSVKYGIVSSVTPTVEELESLSTKALDVNEDAIELDIKERADKTPYTGYLYVEVADKSGNILRWTDSVIYFDGTEPEIGIEFDLNNTDLGVIGYNKSRTANITITEDNIDLDALHVKVKKNGTTMDLMDGDVLQGNAEFAEFSKPSWVKTGNQYKAAVIFSEEGDYQLTVECADICENSKENISESFNIDMTAPPADACWIQYAYKNGSGQPSDHEQRALYKTTDNKMIKLDNSATITIHFEDNVGLDRIRYVFSNTVLDSTVKLSELQNCQEQDVTETNIKNKNFEITLDSVFGGYLYVEAYDNAQNATRVVDGKILFDNLVPTVDITFDATNSTNFYNKSRTATITIFEHNFIPEQTKVITGGPTASGWTKSKDNTYTASVNFSTDGKYKIQVECIDACGNTGTKQSEEFTIDTLKPEIKVNFDNVSAENGNCYKQARTASVVIEEVNYIASNTTISVEARDMNGKTISAPVPGTEITNNAIHSQNIAFDTNGEYTLKITCVDAAGNSESWELSDPSTFIIDKDAPVLEKTDIVYKEKNSGAVAKFINFISFGYFAKEAISVNISTEDGMSGIHTIEYYTEDETAGKQNEKKIVVDNKKTSTKEVSFTLSPDFKGTVYAKATDYSGNVSGEGNYTKATSLILKNKKAAQTLQDTISIEPMSKPNENGIYSGDVKVKLAVKEDYDGINSLSYSAGSAVSGDVEFSNSKDITYQWGETVTLTAKENNNNEVRVQVSYFDNVGNVAVTKTETYKIDITKPVLKITYDNNSNVNDKYFKEVRTAKIEIDELNFNPEDVVISIKRNGTEVTNMKPSAGSWKEDGIKHTASIPFAEDGEYEFTVTYTDMAGNKADYEHKDEFIIDKTVPVVAIQYSNNNAENTAYYRNARLATVEIDEHNFYVSDVKIDVTRRLDGAVVSAPGVGGWSANGDHHQATIDCGEDGEYSITVSYVDMAGNQSEVISKQEFIVDQSEPELKIEGVEAKHAYNSKVVPTVTFTDTNLDTNRSVITLTGKKRGKVRDGFTRAAIGKGQKVTLDIFEETKEIDDIYTLDAVIYDKAGNSIKESVEFSVNRFGSTYDISEETEGILNKYNKEVPDLQVREVNVDVLTEYAVSYVKDGSVQLLTENEDYAVTKSEDTANWKEYTYTIFADNFEKEGNYSVIITSTDAAENQSDNTVNNKEIKFTIDKTSPVITVSGIEDNKIYNAETQLVYVVVKDNIYVEEVEVRLNDTVYHTWDVEAISDVQGDLSFNIDGLDKRQDLSILVKDAAGNTTAKEIKDFLITQNRWVQYYNNRRAVIGTIGGMGSLIGTGLFIFYRRRRL